MAQNLFLFSAQQGLVRMEIGPRVPRNIGRMCHLQTNAAILICYLFSNCFSTRQIETSHSAPFPTASQSNSHARSNPRRHLAPSIQSTARQLVADLPTSNEETMAVKPSLHLCQNTSNSYPEASKNLHPRLHYHITIQRYATRIPTYTRKSSPDYT